MKFSSYVTLYALFFLLFTACSDDDTTTMDTTDDTDQVDTNDDGDTGDADSDDTTDDGNDGDGDGNADIPLGTIDMGVNIEGADKTEGAPPAPNSNLSFEMDTNDQAGYQERGFLIELSSSDDIAGAYLLFKDSNGAKSDGYFDIPFSTGEGDKGINHQKSNRFWPNQHLLSTMAKQVGEQEINVLFDNTIAPGTFCYEICVYNSAGNVSEVVTRCVNVLEWGGNSSIEGEWKFDRAFENDVLQEDDNMTEVDCANGTVATLVETLYEREDWILSLQPGGDYFEIYDELFQDLDFEASTAQCEAVYGAEQELRDKYLGKWTYSTDTGLSIIDFAYENLLDPSLNETFDEGEIYFDSVQAEVLNGELVLTESEETPEGTFVYKAIFKPNN